MYNFSFKQFYVSCIFNEIKRNVNVGLQLKRHLYTADKLTAQIHISQSCIIKDLLVIFYENVTNNFAVKKCKYEH
jgi:hypothetical protein